MSRNIIYNPENHSNQNRSLVAGIHEQCCGCIFGTTFVGLGLIVIVGLFLILERPSERLEMPNPNAIIQELFCASGSVNKAEELVGFSCEPGVHPEFP